MLVLSRKLGEQIVLPHCEVTMTVLGVSGNRVRIGVAAPAGTAVHRREVWDKIAGGQASPGAEQQLQGCRGTGLGEVARIETSDASCLRHG